MYCYRHYHAVSNVSTCSFSYASVAVEFDPTTYTVTESERAVVMFQIVKRTMTTRHVSVLFSTSPGTAKGNRSPGMSCNRYCHVSLDDGVGHLLSSVCSRYTVGLVLVANFEFV